MKSNPRIIIVGAGFAGLQAAQSLANIKAEVILIDRQNYHTFMPLLYQVATAQLAPDQIAVPIRTLLRRASNLKFLKAEVQNINCETQEVITQQATFFYDYLVLATGSKSQFFGVNGAANYAFQLKSLTQAINLRNHLLTCFEQASSTIDPARRLQLLSITVVGGGATGVELVGSILELIKNSLTKDFFHLKWQEVSLCLVQSGDRLLPEFSNSLGKYTLKKLRKLGVKVLLGSRVNQVFSHGLELSNGTYVASATVIWAVGVKGEVPRGLPCSTVGKHQQISVSPTLQVSDYPQIFAIGDLAHIPSHPESLSSVAPEALQQGVYVARALRNLLQGKTNKPFRYFNKGRLAIIGCYSGIGQIAGIELRGFLPWLMWLAVHVVYVPDWRNRGLIVFTWLHNYLVGDRPVRLIFPASSRILPKGKEEVSDQTS